MIWLSEYSLPFVLPQKFGPEAEILDPCIVKAKLCGISVVLTALSQSKPLNNFEVKKVENIFDTN